MIGGGKIRRTADISEQSLQGQMGVNLARITQGRAALMIKELNAEAGVDGGLIGIGNRTGDLVVAEAPK